MSQLEQRLANDKEEERLQKLEDTKRLQLQQEKEAQEEKEHYAATQLCGFSYVGMYTWN